MKKGIFVALAALALTVFAVPDAHGGHHNRPDINLHAWGSNFISSDDGSFPTPLGEGRSLTIFQNGKTKGSGSPSFSATTSIVGLVEGAPTPPECVEAGLFGAPLFQTIVLIYNDGSLLSLIAEDGSFYCLDPLTGTNFLNGGGRIAAGDGRFEGATGTWEATGQVLLPIEAGLFTADVIVDFE